MNREACASLGCRKALHIVTGATHLFATPGAPEQAAAAEWLGW